MAFSDQPRASRAMIRSDQDVSMAAEYGIPFDNATVLRTAVAGHSVPEFRSNGGMETVGSRVRAEREAQGIDRKELAAAAGIAKTTLADLENGRMATTTALHKIADHLGISARWLESGEGAKYRVAESGYSSQSARLDFEKLAGAVQVLMEFLAVRDEPAEWVSDPILLEIAYAVVEEFGEPVAPSNVLFLTKRLAEKRRDAGPPSDERIGPAARRKSG